MMASFSSRMARVVGGPPSGPLRPHEILDLRQLHIRALQLLGPVVVLALEVAVLRAQGVVGVLVVHGRGTPLLPPRCAATGSPPTVGRAAAVLYAQRTRDAASAARAASPLVTQLVPCTGQPKLANWFAGGLVGSC